MVRPSVRWLLLGLPLILAGCTGPSATPSSGGGSYDDQTGAISVLVVDEELLPIPGVFVVAFIDVPDRTDGGTGTTDDAGGLMFGHLPPAPYTVHASIPGHRGVPARVDVSAGGEVEVMLQLWDAPIMVPHHRTQILDGHIGCAVSLGLFDVVPPCDGERGPIVPFKVDAHYRTILGEMVWARTLPTTSDRLTLSLWKSTPCQAIVCMAGAIDSATGTSPVTLKVSKFPGLNTSQAANLSWFANLPGSKMDPDAGAALDQPFRVYSTVFYVSLPPEKFSAIPT